MWCVNSQPRLSTCISINFLTKASTSRANVTATPTVNPVDDARSDEGSVVEDDIENIEGISDDEDLVNESHNDYEAVANIQDVFKQTHGFFEKKFCTVERNIKWKLNLADDASKRLK